MMRALCCWVAVRRAEAVCATYACDHIKVHETDGQLKVKYSLQGFENLLAPDPLISLQRKIWFVIITLIRTGIWDTYNNLLLRRTHSEDMIHNYKVCLLFVCIPLILMVKMTACTAVSYSNHVRSQTSVALEQVACANIKHKEPRSKRGKWLISRP